MFRRHPVLQKKAIVTTTLEGAEVKIVLDIPEGAKWLGPEELDFVDEEQISDWVAEIGVLVAQQRIEDKKAEQDKITKRSGLILPGLGG
jgi:hypothetical protein